jgi:hypothetical protein
MVYNATLSRCAVRVRIPLVPLNSYSSEVRVLGCRPRGRGFDPRYNCNIPRGQATVDGSYPSIEGFDTLSRYKSLLEGKCNPDLCNILVKDKLEK